MTTTLDVQVELLFFAKSFFLNWLKHPEKKKMGWWGG